MACFQGGKRILYSVKGMAPRVVVDESLMIVEGPHTKAIVEVMLIESNPSGS